MEKRIDHQDRPARRFASASRLELDTNCFDEVYLDQVTDLQRLELALRYRQLDEAALPWSGQPATKPA